MALGGLASLFAGLPQGLADAQERRRRDEETQLRQLGILQELKNWKDQQTAGEAGFRSLMGGAGDVQMPQPAGMPGGGQPSGLPSGFTTGADGNVYNGTQRPEHLMGRPVGGGITAPPISGRNVGGGMRAGGALDNWEVQHNNFGGMRKPGVYAGPNAGGFQSFETPEAGLGAMSHQLDRYASGATTGRPLTTLRQIISTWAPPSTPQNPHENNTPLLLQRASQLTGFAPDQPLNVGDPATKAKLMEALVRNEQGGKLPLDPALIQRVAGGQGGGAQSSFAPTPETQKAVGLTERQVAQNIPPMLQGNMNLKALAQAVEKANPNLPGYVKMQVVERLQKLMGTQSQQEWERYKFQSGQEEKQREFDIRQQELHQSREDTRQYRQDSLDVRRDSIAATGARQDKAIAARKPSGDTLIGDDEAKMAAEQYWAGDKSAMQGWGRGAQGSANLAKIRHFVTVMGKEEGKDGKDLAAAVAEFEGLKSGERTLGNLTARLGTGLAEAEIFAPIVLELSNKVDRTQYKDINSILLSAESRTGDENVVRYGVALNALISAYSQVLVRGGVPTDSARAQARESFDKAYSQGQIGALVDQIMVEIKGANKAPGKVKQEMRGGFTGKPTEGGGGGNVLKFDKDGNPVQ